MTELLPDDKDKNLLAALQVELDELEMLEDMNSGAEEGNGFGKYCVLLKQAIRRIKELKSHPHPAPPPPPKQLTDPYDLTQYPPDYQFPDPAPDGKMRSAHSWLQELDSAYGIQQSIQLENFIKRIQIDSTASLAVRNGEVEHALNEWADLASTALQMLAAQPVQRPLWLKNIKDGISTPDEALENMTSQYQRVLQLSRAALARNKGEK